MQAGGADVEAGVFLLVMFPVLSRIVNALLHLRADIDFVVVGHRRPRRSRRPHLSSLHRLSSSLPGLHGYRHCHHRYRHYPN